MNPEIAEEAHELQPLLSRAPFSVRFAFKLVFLPLEASFSKQKAPPCHLSFRHGFNRKALLFLRATFLRIAGGKRLLVDKKCDI